MSKIPSDFGNFCALYPNVGYIPELRADATSRHVILPSNWNITNEVPSSTTFYWFKRVSNTHINPIRRDVFHATQFIFVRPFLFLFDLLWEWDERKEHLSHTTLLISLKKTSRHEKEAQILFVLETQFSVKKKASAVCADDAVAVCFWCLALWDCARTK